MASVPQLLNPLKLLLITWLSPTFMDAVNFKVAHGLEEVDSETKGTVHLHSKPAVVHCEAL